MQTHCATEADDAFSYFTSWGQTAMGQNIKQCLDNLQSDKNRL